MPVVLTLVVDDREVCEELESIVDARSREEFALVALKVGVLALRQARGRLDGDRMKLEGERLLVALNATLDNHQTRVGAELSASLKDYFDPRTGRLTERIERLVKRDGELEQILRRHLDGDDSDLARTLAAHVGEGSTLGGLLDPSSPGGFLNTLTQTLGTELTSQRERIIKEFSLDNKDGALCHLVSELSERHGELGQALEKRIDDVVAEFSLDRDDSALSRLVARVERAQGEISREFSLDQDQSALARIRRELLTVITDQRTGNEQFQRDVLERLTAMTARRDEAARSTRHGEDFETAVFEFIELRSQNAGDIASHVGNQTGIIKNCKVGDVVVELGPEHMAAGARVVIEAKEREGVSIGDALAELDSAKKNRQAGAGMFVFSRRTAPPMAEPLARYGEDVVVAWDADDPQSDVVLLAGLAVAKALCARRKADHSAEAADFIEIDKAIREIERQIGGLDEIVKFTETIQSNSGKVLKRTAIMRTSLLEQVEVLETRTRKLQGVAAQ